MNKQEFLDRIKDDTYIEDWEQVYEKSFELLEWWFKNEAPNIIINGQPIYIIPNKARNDDEKRLTILAVKLIRENYYDKQTN